MQRDNDLIRQLLFEAEREPSGSIVSVQLMSAKVDDDKHHHHLLLLVDAGLMAPLGKHQFRLTNMGHDFLEAVREDTAWNKTKKIARSAGAETIGILFDVAVGLARERAMKMLGAEV